MRDLLGQGTFGQVFKCVGAEDEDDGEAIAIKVRAFLPAGAAGAAGAGPRLTGRQLLR